MKEPSPQLENGYIKVANEIMDAFCRFRIPGETRQILDAIIRKTYGWNKKEDWIAQSQIILMTELLKGNVSRGLSEAITHRLVIKCDNKIKINKNYKEWISFGGNHYNPKLSESITHKKVIADETRVIVNDSKVIGSEGNKRHYTKDTTTKDKDNTIVLSDAKLRHKLDIDLILKTLREKLELPKLDLSERVNRQYAWSLLRKSRKGVDGVLWLIDQAADNDWFRNRITSTRDLWSNQVKIVAQKRGEKNGGVAIISTG